jgi:hypothetical protein
MIVTVPSTIGAKPTISNTPFSCKRVSLSYPEKGLKKLLKDQRQPKICTVERGEAESRQ